MTQSYEQKAAMPWDNSWWRWKKVWNKWVLGQFRPELSWSRNDWTEAIVLGTHHEKTRFNVKVSNAQKSWRHQEMKRTKYRMSWFHEGNHSIDLAREEQSCWWQDFLEGHSQSHCKQEATWWHKITTAINLAGWGQLSYRILKKKIEKKMTLHQPLTNNAPEINIKTMGVPSICNTVGNIHLGHQHSIYWDIGVITRKKGHFEVAPNHPCNTTKVGQANVGQETSTMYRETQLC